MLPEPEMDDSSMIALFINGLKGQIFLSGRTFSNAFLEGDMGRAETVYRTIFWPGGQVED